MTILIVSLVLALALSWLLERTGDNGSPILVDEENDLALRRRIRENREQLRREAEARERKPVRAPEDVQILTDDHARRLNGATRVMRVTDGES